MPPPVFPEYLKLGQKRFGIVPAEGRFNDDNLLGGREVRRGSIARLEHENAELLRHMQPGGGARNIFGGLRTQEGYLMKRVVLGAGYGWRQLYFRLSDDHGGALEYDKQPLVFQGKIQWPPLESIRLARFEDVEESGTRPHAFVLKLVDPVEDLFLQASNEDEMLRWMNALRGATERLRIQQTSVVMRLRWCRESGGDSINMNALDLRIIPPQVFEFVSIKEADFSHNQLRHLTSEIHYLHNLRRLDLSKNSLESLTHDIGTLPSLIQLNLSHNRLTTLPEAIGCLSSLKTLDLSRNELQVIPEGIGGLQALRDVDFSINQLEAMPETLGALTSLTKLNFLQNNLRTIPPEIGALTSVTDLSLQSNKLTVLPISIGGLTQLRRLNLRDNRIPELPEMVGGLTSLRELDLYMNKLTTLPEVAGGLTNLTRLDLAYNRISELPEAVGGLTALRRLGLRENRLVVLPTFIGTLTSLVFLDLGYNGLESYWHRRMLFERELHDFTPKMTEPWRRGLPIREQLLRSANGSKPFKDFWKARYRQIRGKKEEKGDSDDSDKDSDDDDDDGDDDDDSDDDDDDESDDEKDDDDDDEYGSDDGKKKNKTKKKPAGPSLGQKISERWKKTKPAKQRLYDFKKGCSYAKWSMTPERPVWRLEAVPRLLPEELSNFSHLVQLDLRENRLRCLPRYVGNLLSLMKLDLSANQLVELPEAIGNLTNLQKLYVRSNRLRRLPESIGGTPLPAVEGAIKNVEDEYGEYDDEYGEYGEYSDGGSKDDDDSDASSKEKGNQDSDADGGDSKSGSGSSGSGYSGSSGYSSDGEDEKGWEEKPRVWSHGNWDAYGGKRDKAVYPGMKALRFLDAFDNRLKELPVSVGGCASLTKLDLSFNRLVKLPQSLGALTNMVDLRVRHNKLEQLPHALTQMKAGDPNAKEYFHPSYGLCILERSKNPMHIPPKNIPQADVEATLDNMQRAPPPPTCVGEIKRYWDWANAPPISYGVYEDAVPS